MYNTIFVLSVSYHISARNIFKLFSYFCGVSTFLFISSASIAQSAQEFKKLQEENERLKSELSEMKKEKEKGTEKSTDSNSEKLKPETEKQEIPAVEEKKVDTQAIQQSREESFFKLEDSIVVTAARREQKYSDAPSAMYVITEKQIKERGYRTLIDVLHDIPGFDIIHVNGLYPELVHQRGIVGNNQRTLVYVDGIPDNNLSEMAFRGGTIRFPMTNVKQVEVLAGPASAIYGANAFNGIINIITKDGKKSPGHQIQTINGYWEDNFRNPGNGFDLTTRGSSSEIKDFQYSANLHFFKTDGPFFGDTRRLENKDRSPNDVSNAMEKKFCGGVCSPNQNSVGAYWSPIFNDARSETYNITSKFSYKNVRFQFINWEYLQGRGTFSNGFQRIDGKQEGLETGEYDSRNLYRLAGIAKGNSKPGGFSGGAIDFRNNSATFGYLHEFTKKINLDNELIVRHTDQLSSSHEEVPSKQDPYAYLRPGYVTKNAVFYREDKGYELREKLTYEGSKRASTTLGIDLQYNYLPEGYATDLRFRYNNYAVYLQQIYRLRENLTATVGIRHDLNMLWGSINTPRATIVYQPTKDITLKFLVGTGFRAPSAWEMYSATPTRKANLQIEPERLRSAEMGVGYRLKHLYINVTQYYNIITNMILEVATKEPNPNSVGSTWNQNKNIGGQANIHGVELTSDYQILQSLNLSLGYTWNRGEYINISRNLTSSPSSFGRAGDDYGVDLFNAVTKEKTIPSHGQIPNIAQNKFFMGITFYPIPKMSVFTGLNYVDIRRNIASNPTETTPSYTMLKVNLRYTDFIYEGVFLNLLINNAGNQQFFDPGLRVANGSFNPTMHPIEKRNIWLTVGYSF